MDRQQTEKDDHPRTVTEKGKPSEPLSDRAHEIRRKPEGQSQPDDTQDTGNEHDHVGSSIGGSTSRQEWSQQVGKTPKVEGEKGDPDEDEDFDANDSTSRGGSSSDQLAGLRNRGSRPDSKE
jgi:hypothetical protein